MRYDLIVKGGQVLDPGAGLAGHLDVAVAGGRVAAVAPHLDPADAAETVDVNGALVVPGLIDLHVHAFWGCSYWGLELDPVAIRTGVTTAADAGSAGGYNFPGFRRYVIEPARTRILAYLNISSIGLTAQVNELMDLYYADGPLAVDVARAHADLVVGLKVRLNPDISGSAENALAALDRTVAAAEQLRLPLMVHIARRPPELHEILSRLRRGDIVTHCCTGRDNRLLSDTGRLREEAAQARERGVLLDVGHGQGSFNSGVAEKLLALGVYPDTISSDLHAANVNGPVYDLPTTLSKFLLLGMPLPEIVAAVTSRAAAALGRAGELGTLRPGAPADIAALRLESGRFTFMDSHGVELTSDQRLVNVLTVRAGAVLYRAG